MKYRDDLKVEFRAVPFGSFSGDHVLQYRISPDQDLTYYKEYSFLGFKFSIKRKYKTNWHDATKCLNYSSAYLYDESEVWGHPVFINSKKELNEYKERYKTIGEYFDYIDRINKTELNNYRCKRAQLDKTIWE